MAKFRISHTRKRRAGFSGGVKLVIIAIFLGLVFFMFNPNLKKLLEPIEMFEVESDIYYLPDPHSEDEIYHKKHYVISYNENYEQARWVAYTLTRQHLNDSKVARPDYFNEDMSIRTGSASFYDYKNSGYTKGHMVPAADRAYSIEAIEETFLMSNMTPQDYYFNAGIWRELEEQTRDWARSFGALIIVCGPIFPDRNVQRIGENKVAIPDSFFKVILDATNPEIKGIGFIIPNQISTRPLADFARSIDQIEEKTGLDFFHELFTNKLELEIEQNLDLDKWPFDSNRFKIRINQWNNR